MCHVHFEIELVFIKPRSAFRKGPNSARRLIYADGIKTENPEAILKVWIAF